MDTKERFLKVIEKSGLKKKDFAEKLGIVPSTITGIIKGEREPSLQLCKNIEYEFNINSEWLKHGTGEMDIKLDEKNRVAKFVKKASKDPESNTYKFLSIVTKLEEDDFNLICQLCEKLAKKED